MTNKQTNKLREFFSKKNLVYLIIPLALAISCKKYPGGVPGELVVENKFSTKAEVKTYINEKLDKYAKVISSLSKSGLVRQVVNEQVAKKFDGDYNVLIKDLYPAIVNKLNKGNKIAKIGKAKTMVGGPTPEEVPIDTFDPPSSVDLGALQQLLSEPMVVNADTLHPQIYIPFFDDEEDDYNPCLNEPYTSSVTFPYPVVVPYDGDETTGIDIFEGYSYDANGTMVLHSNISECFAKMHTVWAVTINENVNQSGVPNTTSGPVTPPANQRPDLYIPNMTIKEHKESWIKGASDIHMYAGISWENGINPNTGLYETSFRTRPGLASDPERNYDVNFIEIRKFERKEVKNQTSKNIDFTYFPLSSEYFSKKDHCAYLLYRPNIDVQQNTFDYSQCKQQTPDTYTYYFPDKGDYLYYIIYEYDTGFLDWNSGYDYVEIPGNNFNQKVYYQSNESPYYSGRLKILPKDQPSQTYQNTGWADINNSTIVFNSRNR